MGFSNLIYLWTAIIPVIVLLYYFFRKKYTDQPVSSTIFWDEVMQETKASPYLKHLQKNALLYLQLLALILLVLALLNPFVKTTEVSGAQAIWIVDTSATMLAGEGEITTFEAHKKEMKTLVDHLSGRPLTIITTGEEPMTIVRQETDATVIHKAIDGLSVTYEEEQLSKAMDIAQAFVGKTATSIFLFTDSVERGELPIESEHVKWIVKGAPKSLKNVAITRFAATTNEDGTLALLRVKNETDQEQTVKLQILNDQEQVLKEDAVTIHPDAEETKIYEQLPTSATLTATIQIDDHYSADNSMTTLIGENNSQIIVDQQMHELLQRGFQALNTDVKIAPSEQLSTVGDAIIVTNQTELLQQSKSPIVLFGRKDEVRDEVNSLVDVSKDALFAFSSLEDVYVSGVYPAIEGFETIATIAERPFIQRSPRGDLVILTDIEATDWPLHPSFPLFLWSIQNELTEGTNNLGTFVPNESRAVSLAPGEWSIYSSSDEYISSITNANQFKAPSKPGLYSIRSNDEEKQFVVGLSQGERTILEGTSFELGTLATSGEEETSKKSLLIWLLIPILILLVVEWEVQRRRGFTN